MGATLGPYDPTKPDGGLIVVDLVPTPIREAMTSFLSNAACDIAGLMESGYRALGLPALGNQLAVARSNAACYVGASPPLTADVPTLPFTGGQCDTVYTVNYSWTLSNSGTFTGANNYAGPIHGAVHEPPDGVSGSPNQYGRAGIRSNDPPQVSYFTGGSFSDQVVGASVLSVSRNDGQPDDCGDVDLPPVEWPDGVELPPPPSPGDVINEGDIVNVQVEIGGNSVDVSVVVSPVIFNPELGVEFSVGDLKFTLSPSFTLSFDEKGGGADDSEVLEIVEEIRDSVTEELSGDMVASSCSSDLFAAAYTGRGLAGVESLIASHLSIVNFMLLEQCPIDAESRQGLQKVIAGSGTSGLNDVTYVSITEEARAVTLFVSGLPPDLRVYKLAGDDLEAPFGYMCLTETDGDESFNGPPYDVKTRATRYEVGRSRGYPRQIRLSLRRGLDWVLYSYEVP